LKCRTRLFCCRQRTPDWWPCRRRLCWRSSTRLRPTSFGHRRCIRCTRTEIFFMLSHFSSKDTGKINLGPFF
jgi:hypothetical protein